MLRAERERSLLVVALTAVGWMPAAPSFAVEWQVARVRVNGVPLELRSGEFAVAQPALATAVATRWQVPSDGSTRLAMSRSDLSAGHTVFGRQRGRLHETVTLRATGPGSTQVLVTVNDLGATIRRPARLPVRLPAGQRILQVVEHGFGRAAPRTFTLESDKDPQVALSQWRWALTAAGWSLRSADPAGAGSRAWLLWADRGHERIDAAFSRGPDGARIVLQVSGDAQ
jgi:hypothetical protein